MISLKLENSLGEIEDNLFSPTNLKNQPPMTINNNHPRVGAVGFISVLFPFLLPLGLVKVDEETREQMLVQSAKVFEMNNVIIGSVKGVDR